MKYQPFRWQKNVFFKRKFQLTILGYGTLPNEYISHSKIPKLHISDLFENRCKKRKKKLKLLYRFFFHFVIFNLRLLLVLRELSIWLAIYRRLNYNTLLVPNQNPTLWLHNLRKSEHSSPLNLYEQPFCTPSTPFPNKYHCNWKKCKFWCKNAWIENDSKLSIIVRTMQNWFDPFW